MSELIGPLKAPLSRLKSVYGEDFHKRGPLFAGKNKELFGECFSLVKQFVPELGYVNTQNWMQGEAFFNISGLPKDAFYNPLYQFGSAIATFDENGKVYKAGKDNPRSTHGAIFLFSGYEEFNGRKVPGLYVIDQWNSDRIPGPPIDLFSGIRFIKVQQTFFRSNDARAFSIVMLRK